MSSESQNPCKSKTSNSSASVVSWEGETGGSPDVSSPVWVQSSRETVSNRMEGKNWHPRLSSDRHSWATAYTHPTYTHTLTHTQSHPLTHTAVCVRSTQPHTLTSTHTEFTLTFSHTDIHRTHPFTLSHTLTMVQRQCTVTLTFAQRLTDTRLHSPTRSRDGADRSGTQSYLGRSKMLQQYKEMSPEELCNETMQNSFFFILN